MEKEKVIALIWESLNEIPEDDVCDECEWVCQKINDKVEKLFSELKGRNNGKT